MRVVAIGKRRATYEDLCKVPDTMVAEIIDAVELRLARWWLEP